jgi:predicted PurR-regulated permease PerM
MDKGEQGPPRLLLDVSWKSIFRVLTGILLAYLAVVLWPLLELIILALLIAVAVYPIVRWSCRKGSPRWVGLLLASGALVTGVLVFFLLLGPMVIKQSGAFIENLPKLKEEITSHLPESGVLGRLVNRGFSSFSEATPLLEKAMKLGKSTVVGIFNFFVVLVVAIYLMIDGPRLYKWLLAFFPVEQRRRIAVAVPEVSDLIFSYTTGLFITASLCATFVFLLLTILHVPMALLLGVIAGVFDILPIIGLFLSVLPSMAMGLTVSTTTAIIIAVCYVAYHLFETYVIVPKVYGKKLQLSTLTVLLALMAAALVAGVPGAIMILPIVAAYPVIERVWLAPKLEPDTVEKHEALEPEKKTS